MGDTSDMVWTEIPLSRNNSWISTDSARTHTETQKMNELLKGICPRQLTLEYLVNLFMLFEAVFLFFKKHKLKKKQN